MEKVKFGVLNTRLASSHDYYSVGVIRWQSIYQSMCWQNYTTRKISETWMKCHYAFIDNSRHMLMKFQQICARTLFNSSRISCLMKLAWNQCHGHLHGSCNKFMHISWLVTLLWCPCASTILVTSCLVWWSSSPINTLTIKQLGPQVAVDPFFLS